VVETPLNEDSVPCLTAKFNLGSHTLSLSRKLATMKNIAIEIEVNWDHDVQCTYYYSCY